MHAQVLVTRGVGKYRGRRTLWFRRRNHPVTRSGLAFLVEKVRWVGGGGLRVSHVHHMVIRVPRWCSVGDSEGVGSWVGGVGAYSGG